MLIRIDHLVKDYTLGDAVQHVLKDVHFGIKEGEFVAIMGPSGSGKSTLMNILGCLDTPTGGQYLLDGKVVSAMNADALAAVRQEKLGFVFQGYNLLPRRTILENVTLPLVYTATPMAVAQERALQLLEKVGIARDYAHRRPNQLSGGQQQRVAIARALINNPKVILADEPTGNLDTKTSQDVMRLFTELNKTRNITIVLVTHEPDIAAYAQRLIRLRDGVVEYDGPVKAATKGRHA